MPANPGQCAPLWDVKKRKQKTRTIAGLYFARDGEVQPWMITKDRRPRWAPFMNRFPTIAPAIARKALLLLTLSLIAATGGAQSPGPDERLQRIQAAELNLIRGLVEEGVLPKDKARALLQKAGIDPARLEGGPAYLGAPAPEPNAPTPAPNAQAPSPESIITDTEHQKIIEQVRQDVRAQAGAEQRASPLQVPEWAKRISFSGDLRLRYQRNDFAADNADDAGGLTPPNLNTAQAIAQWYQLPAGYQFPPGTPVNALDSHEFVLMRARLNVEDKINDTLKAAVRLSAVGGNDTTTNPVDYDVVLGRYGRPFSAAVSLAYLTWQPTQAWTLTGGRMLNPYFKSDLIFAPDLSLDGVYLGYAPQWTENWGSFVNVGAHPLQTNQSGPFNTAQDQWLFASQIGASWKRFDDSKLQIAAAYYDFSGLQGKPDPQFPTNNTLNDDSAPLFRQFGNTMFDLHYLWDMSSPLYAYAGQFRLVNFGAEYEYARFDPLRLAVQLDWVRNVGFNATQIEQRIGPAIAGLPYVLGPNGTQLNGVTDARTNGYLVNLRIGAAQLRQSGDWQVFTGVRYLQRDAVPDAFTSPDYRLGGTDNQAAFLGLNYAISPAVSLTVRYISARSIDSGPKFGVDTWFLDLNGHF